MRFVDCFCVMILGRYNDRLSSHQTDVLIRKLKRTPQQSFPNENSLEDFVQELALSKRHKYSIIREGEVLDGVCFSSGPSPLRLTHKRPASEEALRERRKQTISVPNDENTERPSSCVHVYPFTGNSSMRLQRPRRG